MAEFTISSTLRKKGPTQKNPSSVNALNRNARQNIVSVIQMARLAGYSADALSAEI